MCVITPLPRNAGRQSSHTRADSSSDVVFVSRSEGTPAGETSVSSSGILLKRCSFSTLRCGNRRCRAVLLAQHLLHHYHRLGALLPVQLIPISVSHGQPSYSNKFFCYNYQGSFSATLRDLCSLKVLDPLI